MRQRKFKIGDKVKMNNLALQQNSNDDRYQEFKTIFDTSNWGEVVHLEENLPDNSNFRYSVNFDGKTFILNENQIDPAT